MFNLKNGAFLLGLVAGIVLTALLAILSLTLVQVTRPVPGAIPQATPSVIAAATAEPTAAPAQEPTAVPTAAPAQEPTAEPTSSPAGEPTVESTAVPASEPTVEPTAAPAPALTDFPYKNFPTPLPEPVTVPYNGGSQGLGVDLTSVSLDGVPQTALQIKPEQVFNVAMDYNVWSTLEPIPGGDNSGRCASTCIVNLTVGMVSSDGSYKPLFCIYQGAPGNEPGVQSSWKSSITPPTTPGVYGLRLDYHLTYNCEQALADVNPGRQGISLATIKVEPSAVPAGEPTIGPTAVPAAEQRVPKTGQTQCWDAAGNLIDCAGTGQDGEYQKGIDPAVVRTGAGAATSNVLTWTGVRFVENGDGTVTDNATGLIWLKNANCFDRSAWATALNRANTLASPSCGLSDGSVAGDWRLPNVNEMQSLIDPTQANPPLPAGHPFTDVQIEYYWTSTTIPSLVTNAWLVGMQWNGFVTGSGVKAIGAWNMYVWPVR